MGGWALKLFCCDWDLDLIQQLSEECGLKDLEKKDGKRHVKVPDSQRGALRQAEHSMWAAELAEDKQIHVIPKPLKSSDAIHYSVFNKLCTDPGRVREYLDSSAAFTKRMTKLRSEAASSSPGWLRDPYGPGYQICILGACGMTLGVKLSNADLGGMRKYFKNCGLMRDAVTQIEAALKGYKNGTPWDFGSVGRYENMKAGGAPYEDLCFPGVLTNVWAPDHGRCKGERKHMQETVMGQLFHTRPGVDGVAQCLASLFFDPYDNPRTKISSTMADSHPEPFRKQAEEIVEMYETDGSNAPEFSNAVCGSCGAEKGKDGQVLLSCGKCKKRRYCSPACQKAEWEDHKKACIAPKKLNPAATFISLLPGQV